MTKTDNAHMSPMTGNGTAKDGGGTAGTPAKIQPKPTQRRVIPGVGSRKLSPLPLFRAVSSLPSWRGRPGGAPSLFPRRRFCTPSDKEPVC
jgi:hypothetical protein